LLIPQGEQRLSHPNPFDNIFWEEFVSKAVELRGNPAACEQLVYRFLMQYLPALIASRTLEDSERVWRALWSYMTAPITRAKPFGLSYSSADDLIADIQSELCRLGYPAQE
jgi:hypothetical protein